MPSAVHSDTHSFKYPIDIHDSFEETTPSVTSHKKQMRKTPHLHQKNDNSLPLHDAACCPIWYHVETMMERASNTSDLPGLPPVWDYTDYRQWLRDMFQARKAVHSWYSYGVLAQKAGFLARDYLLRVMRGDRGLSPKGSEQLATALGLHSEEHSYFLALVRFNQAKHDSAREFAWTQMLHARHKSKDARTRRHITEVHRQVLSGWQHLVIRSLLEMRPNPGDWSALGKRLRPRRSRSSVRRSIHLLQECGLVEKRADGFWYATDKSIATSPEVAVPAVRQFHRNCLKLASESIERFPTQYRNVSGVVLGISRASYDLVCQRLTNLRQELTQIAENDPNAEGVYQLTMALFPMTDVIGKDDEACN